LNVRRLCKNYEVLYGGVVLSFFEEQFHHNFGLSVGKKWPTLPTKRLS
jgi:hypothetical protein